MLTQGVLVRRKVSKRRWAFLFSRAAASAFADRVATFRRLVACGFHLGL